LEPDNPFLPAAVSIGWHFVGPRTVVVMATLHLIFIVPLISFQVFFKKLTEHLATPHQSAEFEIWQLRNSALELIEFFLKNFVHFNARELVMNGIQSNDIRQRCNVRAKFESRRWQTAESAQGPGGSC
jgi:hypothetical protein